MTWWAWLAASLVALCAASFPVGVLLGTAMARCNHDPLDDPPALYVVPEGPGLRAEWDAGVPQQMDT